MRYKKFLLGVIASVLCLGLLNGCSSYSHDFNSSEEAQKYILSKLKDKYNEEFIITEVKKYKEEKIGLNCFTPKQEYNLARWRAACQEIYGIVLEPPGGNRSGRDLFHLRDRFEIEVNFDRNVSCLIAVDVLMDNDFFNQAV